MIVYPRPAVATLVPNSVSLSYNFFTYLNMYILLYVGWLLVVSLFVRLFASDLKKLSGKVVTTSKIIFNLLLQENFKVI